ncbi:MAG: hypothetical protein ACOY9Y_14060 [Bacillota bacterium]
MSRDGFTQNEFGLALKLGLFTALVMISVYFLWPIPAIVLAERETGDVVYRQGTQAGRCFELRFLHSYEKGWVEETYQVRDQRSFVLTTHRFQVFCYDARDQTYPGDFSLDQDGFARVTNIAKSREVVFSHLLIRVANTVPQFLEAEGASVALGELVPGGSLLILRIVPVPRIGGKLRSAAEATN